MTDIDLARLAEIIRRAQERGRLIRRIILAGQLEANRSNDND